MNNNNKDEIEIDLREIVGLMISRIWILILAGFMAALATALISKFLLTPIYTSTTKLYIVNKTASLTSLSLSDLQLGTQLTKDYMILVKSRPVTEQVIHNLELNMEHEGLVGIMTITNPSDSRVLEITVQYPDAVMAKRIVDEIALVSAERIAVIMDMQKPNIFEEGHVAKYQSSPSVMKNTVIGGAAGVIIAAFIICLIYIMDDTIKSSEDVERYLGINTIGILPLDEGEDGSDAKKKKRKKVGKKES